MINPWEISFKEFHFLGACISFARSGYSPLDSDFPNFQSSFPAFNLKNGIKIELNGKQDTWHGIEGEEYKEGIQSYRLGNVECGMPVLDRVC